MIFYAIGTKVNLKSGGAIMLIVDFNLETGESMCAWKNNENDIREEWYPNSSLEIYIKV